jgi:hypothetical protein
MKICFKCGHEKPFEMFYRHPKMRDGHLGKCKDCTKKDTQDRFNEKLKKPDFVEAERERQRQKYYRLGYKDKHKPLPEDKKKAIDAHKAKYPEKTMVRNKLSGIKPIVKGNHMHHWSYNIEHAKDVIELNPLIHALIHRFMIYDQERFMYRRIDTMELLDTKESHLNYIELIKSTKS